jgi:hypothetical protein
MVVPLAREARQGHLHRLRAGRADLSRPSFPRQPPSPARPLLFCAHVRAFCRRRSTSVTVVIAGCPPPPGSCTPAFIMRTGTVWPPSSSMCQIEIVAITLEPGARVASVVPADCRRTAAAPSPAWRRATAARVMQIGTYVIETTAPTIGQRLDQWSGPGAGAGPPAAARRSAEGPLRQLQGRSSRWRDRPHWRCGAGTHWGGR